MSDASAHLNSKQLRSVLQRIGTAANTMSTFAALAADRVDDQATQFDFHALYAMANYIELMADAAEGTGSIASLLGVDFPSEKEATHA